MYIYLRLTDQMACRHLQRVKSLKLYYASCHWRLTDKLSEGQYTSAPNTRSTHMNVWLVGGGLWSLALQYFFTCVLSTQTKPCESSGMASAFWITTSPLVLFSTWLVYTWCLQLSTLSSRKKIPSAFSSQLASLTVHTFDTPKCDWHVQRIESSFRALY